MLKALLDRAAGLATRAAQLRTALNRLQSVRADAEAAVDQLAADNQAYLRIVRRASERQREIDDFAQQFAESRRVAAGVLLYDVTTSWPELERDIRSLREQSRQAPGPIAAYLKRTGGLALNLSDETELLIQLLDEQRRARFAAELRDAPPSTIRDLYEAATHMDSDEAASLTRYVESTHGDGWRGRTPESSEQVQAAVALRGLIAETQAARILPELDECAAVVEQAARLAAKAENEKLHNVTAVNLQQHPELAPLWDAERPLLEQAAAEAAEQAAEPEPAPAEAAL